MPVSAPFQPACAAPITRAFGSTNRIGPQSAAVTPIARPSVRVTMASARGRDAPCQGAVATTTSGEWIWYTVRKCAGATPICSAMRRRFSATWAGSSCEPMPALRLA